MGLLSGLLNFIKKWWWLILLIIIVIVVFFPVLWGAITTFFSSLWTSISGLFASGGFFAKLGLWKSLALGFGLLAIVDPEAATAIIDNLGEVATSIVETGVGVIGSGLSAILSNPVVLIAGGLFLWYFLSSRNKNKIESSDYIANEADVTPTKLDNSNASVAYTPAGVQ